MVKNQLETKGPPLYRHSRHRSERYLFGAIAFAAIYLFYNDYGTQESHFWQIYHSGCGNLVMMQSLAVCFMSYCADFFVLGWHAQNPPHPKFRMLLSRKICIGMHIVGGCIELFSFVCAFFAKDPTPYAKAAVFAALFLHIPSATYQIPIIFGVKKIMIPSYIIFVIMHLMTSLDLFEDPTNAEKLLKMCIALHGYVWVRVTIFILKILGIMKTHEYTTAVLFTGFLTTPLVFGPASNFLYVYAIVAFHFVNPLLVRWGLAPWGETIEEYDRETVIFDRNQFEKALIAIAKHKAPSEKANQIKVLSDHDLAKACFEEYDHSNDGLLQHSEVFELLASIGYPKDTIQNKIRSCDVDASGALTFHEFYSTIWQCSGNHHNVESNNLTKTLFKVIDLNENTYVSPSEQATIIFNALDVDKSGGLSMEEISEVLASWGLPVSETAAYMKKFDKNDDRVIDLDEFKEHFSPMWNYAFKLLEEEISFFRTTVVEKKKSYGAIVG